MALAITDLKIDLRDDGISDLVLAAAAADQGTSAETMRPVFAGLAEGTIIGTLAGAAEAQKVGGAVSSIGTTIAATNNPVTTAVGGLVTNVGGTVAAVGGLVNGGTSGGTSGGTTGGGLGGVLGGLTNTLGGSQR